MASEESKDDDKATSGDVAIHELPDGVVPPPLPPHSTPAKKPEPAATRKRGPLKHFWLVFAGLVVVASAAGMALSMWTTEEVEIEVPRPEATPDPVAPPVVEVAAKIPATDDTSACVESHFPAGTFGKEPKLGSMCKQTNVWRIGDEFAALVKAGGSGDGAQAWMNLGWYESAVIAAVRADCCADAQRLQAPAPASTCESVESALTSLGAEPTPDQLKSFSAVIDCLAEKDVKLSARYKEVPKETSLAEFKKYFRIEEAPAKPESSAAQ